MTSKITRASTRPKSFWQHHIQQWKKSGRSEANYCRDQGLNAGTFYNWCSDEAKAGNLTKDKSGSTAVLTLLLVTKTKTESIRACSTPGPAITLEHSLGRFIFPVDVPVESIEQ